MTPITYTIPEAAKILKCNEENILYMGSRGAFSINIDEPWEYPNESKA